MHPQGSAQGNWGRRRPVRRPGVTGFVALSASSHPHGSSARARPRPRSQPNTASASASDATPLHTHHPEMSERQTDLRPATSPVNQPPSRPRHRGRQLFLALLMPLQCIPPDRRSGYVWHQARSKARRESAGMEDGRQGVRGCGQRRRRSRGRATAPCLSSHIVEEVKSTDRHGQSMFASL